MTFSNILQKVEPFLIKNSPTILTGIGLGGVIVTAVMTHKAALRADELLDGDEDLRLRVERTWKVYIPPVASGLLTMGAIFASNRVSSNRLAALAAAYSLSEKTLLRYKNHVVEHLGEKPANELNEAFVKQDVKISAEEDRLSSFWGDADDRTVVYDQFLGRFFVSDMESLRAAQNTLNRQVLSQGYAGISDFYSALNLDSPEIGDILGWTSDDLLELGFTSILAQNNQPVLSFLYDPVPQPHYYKHS